MSCILSICVFRSEVAIHDFVFFLLFNPKYDDTLTRTPGVEENENTVVCRIISKIEQRIYDDRRWQLTNHLNC